MKIIRERLVKLTGNKTLQVAALFSLSSTFLSFSNMLAGLIVINWLSPEDLGLWNSIYVALYYVSFMQLGVFNALNREMPFYLGKGMPKFAQSLVATTQWHSKILVLIVLIGTFVFVGFCFINSVYNDKILFSIANLGLVIALQLTINFLTVTFRANKSFKVLTKINFIQSAVILFSLIAVYIYGYYGYVFRFVIISLSLFIMMYAKRPFKIKSRLDISNYKLLLKTGVPLFILVFGLNITDTFNRLVLLKISDYESIGYYYPAIAIIVAMRVLPGAVSQFLYPKISFEVGKSNDLNKIWGWIWKTLISIVAIMTPFAILGYFILPYMFELFFSEYIKSIDAAQLALFSGLFAGSYIIMNVFLSLKSWTELAFLTVVKVCLYLGLQYYFAIKISPIYGVALGTLIADSIFFVVMVLTVWFVLKRKNSI